MDNQPDNSVPEAPSSQELEKKLSALDIFKSSIIRKKREEQPKMEIKYEEKRNIENSKPDPKLYSQFEIIFEKLQNMRKERDAPNDKIQEDVKPDPLASAEDQDFQVLVSMILGSQTRDEVMADAVKTLKKNNFTIDHFNSLSEDEILPLIKHVNYNKTKAKNVKKLASLLVNELNKKIPLDKTQLLKLPGVGPKIAVVYLNWKNAKPVGIGVDTHVHRISNRIGLVRTKSPEETRLELEKMLDPKYWEVDDLLVGFGQQICLPQNPKCHMCLLNDLCEYGKSQDEMQIPQKKMKQTYTFETKKSEEKQEKKDEEPANGFKIYDIVIDGFDSVEIKNQASRKIKILPKK